MIDFFLFSHGRPTREFDFKTSLIRRLLVPPVQLVVDDQTTSDDERRTRDDQHNA
jgi:hypothetical protein